MRFDDLEGLSEPTIERLRHRFRNEEVLTVLPVRVADSPLDSLLVATRTMLAILAADAGSTEAWMTRWAPWDAVRFADMGATTAAEDVFFLTVVVHRARFHAELHGELGQRALRDFVVAAERGRRAVATER